MKRIKPEIIVFDLYNTLIKIERNKGFFLKLYKQSSTGFGVSLPHYFQSLLQNPREKLFDIFPTEFQTLFHTNIQALTNEIESICLFDETLEVLSELTGDYRLYLISNLAQSYEYPYYAWGLGEYFEQAIFSFDVGLTKPDVRIFNLVEKHSGKKGKQILMIGDSPKADIQGAKAMNWQHLRINRDTSNRKANEIHSLLEIKGILEIAE